MGIAKHHTRHSPPGLWGLLLTGVWLALAACQADPSEADFPVYLAIDTFQLRTDAAREGSASEQITEGWLFLEGDFLGAYSLPASVPLLGRGEQAIELRPGIRDNGIATTPQTYPFYRPYRRSVDLQLGQTPALAPETAYRAETRFAFIEDFESGRPVFGDLQAGSSENELRPLPEGAYEGNFSGRVLLTRDAPVVQLATLERYREWGAGDRPVYLELNYRSEVPVLFGLIGYDDALPNQGRPIFDPGFLPRPNWNKIYFNFTPLVRQLEVDAFQVVFQATLPQENGVYTMDEATIWLDNIKLVHF